MKNDSDDEKTTSTSYSQTSGGKVEKKGLKLKKKVEKKEETEKEVQKSKL